MKIPNFPQLAVISEFLDVKDECPKQRLMQSSPEMVKLMVRVSLSNGQYLHRSRRRWLNRNIEPDSSFLCEFDSAGLIGAILVILKPTPNPEIWATQSL